MMFDGVPLHLTTSLDVLIAGLPVEFLSACGTRLDALSKSRTALSRTRGREQLLREAALQDTRSYDVVGS